MIEFAGIRSDEKYLVVEHYPQRTFPKRKYLIQAVPGRSGDLYIEEAEDAFENYDQQYSVFMDALAPGLPQVSRGIAEWLLGNPGYQRLEDSYDPDFYRMAVYVGGEEFINYFNEYGRGTMKFNCAPKRFYKSGEKEIQLENGAVLYSPSTFRSHPIFTILCNSIGRPSGKSPILTITDKNGKSKDFEIDIASSLHITIDSDRHTAIREGNPDNPDSQPMNVNDRLKNPYENLYLDSASSISWNQYISDVRVIPRWWTV